MTTEHPCAAVPVSTVSAHAHYCHHHQAWFANVDSFDQVGEDVPQRWVYESVEFGPFDSVVEVTAWLQVKMREHIDGVEERAEVLYSQH